MFIDCFPSEQMSILYMTRLQATLSEGWQCMITYRYSRADPSIMRASVANFELELIHGQYVINIDQY